MVTPSSFRRRAGLKIAIRTGCALTVAGNVLAMAGCLNLPSNEVVGRLIRTGASPTPTPATVTGAWREAQAYIADRPGADVLLGSGDSMLPRYRSRTLLVTELRPYQDWLPGQTVVFRGDHGWPVAHLLVAKTAEGWRAAGAARAEFDETLVTPHNYLGTVAKAYELPPTGTLPTPSCSQSCAVAGRAPRATISRPSRHEASRRRASGRARDSGGGPPRCFSAPRR